MAISIPKPIITKEHGSWAVLLIPMAIAAGRAGAWKSESSIFTVAVISAFLSYIPAQTLLRNALGFPQDAQKVAASATWGLLSLVVAGTSTLYLILNGYVLLIAIAGFAILSFLGNFLLITRYQKSIASDLVGMAGLTLSAPALYYVNSGLLGSEALSLYALSFLFFGSSVVYVHMKIRAVEMRKDHLSVREKLSAAKLNILYHVAVIAVVAVLAVWHWTPVMTVIAFVPMTIHALYGTYTLSSRVRFKRLGLLLLAHSFLFAFLLLIGRGE